ncbi:hypothetical protein C8F04DRAFT_1130795, partial [Mycena alexandri]
MNVAHAPFLFLFNLFFCLRSFFHWLLTWTPIWGQLIAGIYPCHQILTIQSQLSPSLCVTSLHIMYSPRTVLPLCVFIHLDFGRVRQGPIGSGRGLDSPPNYLLQVL